MAAEERDGEREKERKNAEWKVSSRESELAEGSGVGGRRVEKADEMLRSLLAGVGRRSVEVELGSHHCSIIKKK